MKKNTYMILGGVAALHAAVFGGVFLGGCKSHVLEQRDYIPAADQPQYENTVQPVNTPANAAPLDTAKQPAATNRPARKTGGYAPFEGATTSPVSGPAQKSGAKSQPQAMAAGGTYIIKSGDTLGKIANTNGVSLNALLKANNLDLQSAKRIRPGQKLVIPGRNEVKSPRSVNHNTAKAVNHTAATGSAGGSKATPAAGLVGADGMYTVVSGDSIPKIARRLGIKASDLQKANNLSDEATRRLQIGQKLIVPGKSGNTAAATTVSTTAPTTTTAADQTATDAELAKLLDSANNATVIPTQPGTDTAATAPTTNPTESIDLGVLETSGTTTDLVPVEETISVEAFAAKHNTTAEEIYKHNTSLVRGADLPKGEFIFVPITK